VPPVAETLDERVDGLPGGHSHEDRLEVVRAFKRLGGSNRSPGVARRPAADAESEPDRAIGGRKHYY
jgi:hypothetical protein